MYRTTKYTFITLVPRKAELVAVLETEAQRVGYTDTVVLSADESYDPDNVQVDKFYCGFNLALMRWMRKLDCFEGVGHVCVIRVCVPSSHLKEV